jgi:F0F1-type ATP synthase membrane subunit b/b'
MEQERTAAKHEAHEMRTSARRDAAELLENAETRARELGRNAEAIWRERRRLIDDVKAVGEQLVEIGETEAKRFPHADVGAVFAADAREQAPNMIEPQPESAEAAQT